MDGPRGEEPLLPGAAPVTGPDRAPRRGPSLLVIAAVGLGVAAVVGLLIGAVWGLSSKQSAPPAAAPVAPVPSVSGLTPGPTQSTSTQPTPEQSTPSQPTPGVTSEPPPPPPPPSGEAGPDDFPAAPASSQQSSHKWQVGHWQITNTGGTIGMLATVTNSHKKARSGSFTMYLYVDGQPLATLTGSATDVPGGGSVPVMFSSQDKWGPGAKTLLFMATP